MPQSLSVFGNLFLYLVCIWQRVYAPLSLAPDSSLYVVTRPLLFLPWSLPWSFPWSLPLSLPWSLPWSLSWSLDHWSLPISLSPCLWQGDGCVQRVDVHRHLPHRVTYLCIVVWGGETRAASSVPAILCRHHFPL